MNELFRQQGEEGNMEKAKPLPGGRGPTTPVAQPSTFLEKLLKKVFSKQFIVYCICGVITTLVNFLFFQLFAKRFGADQWFFYNFLPIIISIAVAYLLNRTLVFHSHNPIFPELVKFVGSRLLVSVIFEYFFIWLIYNVGGWTFELNILGVKLLFAKVLSQVGVILANYLVGVLFVFTKKKA